MTRGISPTSNFQPETLIWKQPSRMASTRLFVLLIIGTVLLCQVSGFLDELLAEHELPQEFKRGCRNAYSGAICGKVITGEHCARKKGSRMGSFARSKCKRLCGLC